MSKALIVGAAGFVGGYLAHELQKNHGMEVHATKLSRDQLALDGVTVHDLNILNKEEIIELLYRVRPDYIFHLAAQSSVSVAWNNPGLTIDINVKGSVNMLDAVRELFYKPRVLMIGSGEEYGHIREGETPISEENHLRPGNIYAATKACQNMISSIYTQAYDMNVMMVRAFNHIGPSQLPIFVIADFCKQVAEIEAGKKEPVMYVGNLAAKRDFTDVRDVVRAYALLIQKGIPGETYNVGSGHAYAIREILDLIISLSGREIKVEIDPNKIRPVDVPIIEADITKLHEVTGWQPDIPIRQTIQETLDYWRARV
jgi:GDP-4-dehydro-6-deoxy-D-mannose reductase